MRLAVACCCVSAALMLSGCSSNWRASPPDHLPLNYGNGVGSEIGNYPAQTDGEMRGPSGERCVIFNWDRPLTKDLAVRLRSSSCESRERPDRMVCTELSRTVIPLSESNLRGAQVQTGQ
ncbi:hypothetical protein [Azospirillum sp. sgz302134]